MVEVFQSTNPERSVPAFEVVDVVAASDEVFHRRTCPGEPASNTPVDVVDLDALDRVASTSGCRRIRANPDVNRG